MTFCISRIKSFIPTDSEIKIWFSVWQIVLPGITVTMFRDLLRN